MNAKCKTARMKVITILIALGILGSINMTAQDRYEATMDISEITNDKIAISLQVPRVEEKNALFVFPKVVPGSYDKSDYGRFIENFRAFTSNGRKVRVKKNDVNSYRIKKASKVTMLKYLVNDTWDEPSSNFIFQPSGTNFVAEEEFVLNNFGLVGYFNGHSQQYPYRLNITHDPELYGATSLHRIQSTPTLDVFEAENYVELVDQPILYASPDTLSYYEGGAKIGIAVYSPADAINAELIKEWIQPITAAASFVLGNIPTDEYWFLLHFFDWDDPSFALGPGAFGALEHKKSSLYFVPTYSGFSGPDMESVKSTIYSMATHEFLHILAPLNLHSEEIAYFDFYDTEMSKHLWLYEGVTEYLSIKSLLLGGVIELEDMTEEIISKMKSSARYANVPFTELSSNIIDPEMQKMFPNVYEKGALLALALDIKVAEITNGEVDLIDLVLDLIDTYGMGKPFKDDELFDVITAKVDPQLRSFFTDYIEQSNPLPLEELFSLAGMSLTEVTNPDKLTFGRIRISFDAETGLLIMSPGDGNTIFPGPLAIAELNGEEISFRLVRKYLTRPENDHPLTIGYIEKGALKTMTVTPVMGSGDQDYVLDVKENMSPSEELLFNKLFLPRTP